MILGGNLANQNIDWWHSALDSTGEHSGDLVSRIGDLNFNYGVTDNWNLQVNFLGGTRNMYFPGTPNIHHRNEKKSGLANIRVIFRYLDTNQDFGPGDRFFLGFGLSIPSDNTLKEDPFSLGKQGLDHTHFSMSEGVLKGIGEIQFFRRTESPFLLGFVGRLESPFGPSKYGYQPGTEVAMSGMSYLHGKRVLGAMPFFIISGQFRSRNYWNGKVSPNSEASIVQTGAGLTWNLGESLITLSAQSPFIFKTNMVDEANSVNSRTEVFLLSLSFRKMFNLVHGMGKKDKKHDH